eukprot:Sdes_comp18144_c0_seq1m7622
MNLIFLLTLTHCWLIAQVLPTPQNDDFSSGIDRSGDWSCEPMRTANGEPYCGAGGPFYQQLLENASNVFVGNLPPQDNGVQAMLPIGGPPGKHIFIPWCSANASTDPILLGQWYVQLLKKWATAGHHDGSVNTGGAVHDFAERTGIFGFTDVHFKVAIALVHVLGDLHSNATCATIVEKTGGIQNISLGYHFTIGPATYMDPKKSIRDVSQSICKKLPCCLPDLQRTMRDQLEWDTSYTRVALELQRLCSPRYVKNSATDCNLPGDISCLGPYDSYPQAYNGKPNSPASCNCM